MKNVRRGFTLIELLVVIAIIALLAAILFPVFARARENARKSSCLNNLKQLGVGFLQYTQDYDESLPSVWGGGTGANQEGGWIYYNPFGIGTNNFVPARGSVFPYVKNAQIYQCPSDTLGRRSGNSYAVNGCMNAYAHTTPCISWPTPCFGPGRHLSAFNNVALWLMLGEENTGGSTDDGYMSLNNAWTPRHLQGTNLVFLDGHVKFVLVQNNELMPIDYQFAGGTSCPP